MIIDSHQHVFWHRKNDADLVANMDEHNIDVSWLLTWEVPPTEDSTSYHGALNPCWLRADGTHAGIVLSDVVRARDRYPQRFIVGYAPDPRKGKAPEAFEAAWHMHGVRVCGEWKFRMPFDDPRCLNLFRMAGRLKCPVVLHLDVPYLPDADSGEMVYQPAWYGGTVANLRRACQACPDTIFCGHGPGFWREISGDADAAPSNYPETPVTPGGRLYELFESNPNLYGDMSAGSGRRALARDPDNAVKFLRQFQDRLLFGRDCYDGALHEFLQSLELPDELLEKIYFRNAAALVEHPGK